MISLFGQGPRGIALPRRDIRLPGSAADAGLSIISRWSWSMAIFLVPPALVGAVGAPCLPMKRSEPQPVRRDFVKPESARHGRRRVYRDDSLTISSSHLHRPGACWLRQWDFHGIRGEYDGLPRCFPRKPGFPFGAKCSKTCAATVNRPGLAVFRRTDAVTVLPGTQPMAAGTRSRRAAPGAVGASPSGKAGDFDSPMRRFESSRPSHPVRLSENFLFMRKKGPPMAGF